MLCIGASLTGATAAQASTLDYQGGQLVLTAGEEVNFVDVDAAPCRNQPAFACMDVQDQGFEVTITSAAASEAVCEYVDPDVPDLVECDELDSFTANLGDGDDRFTAQDGWTGASIVHAGPGKDEILHPRGNDQLFGDAGNDYVTGGEGNDLVSGGEGDDGLENFVTQEDAAAEHDNPAGSRAYPGADTISGGPGRDSISYSDIGAPVAVSLDGAANDSPGGDSVGGDVEVIEGTTGNDTITGDDGAQNLLGRDGNDTLSGRGGPDRLQGDNGNDQRNGEGGDDALYGFSGDDTLDGGAGHDTFHGDYPPGLVTFRAGNDTIRARDGEVDSVACGLGGDIAVVDAIDAVSGDCESIDRGATVVTPVVPGGRALAVRAPKSIKRKRLLRRGLAVRLTCPSACKAALRLRYKRRTLGTARKTLARAGTATIRVKVARKNRRFTRRLRGGKLKLRVRVVQGSKRTTLTRTVKLRR